MDSNLVAALIIAREQAMPRLLLRPARSGAKLLIGGAGDLTRLRCVSSSSYCVAALSGLGSTTTTACSYSPRPD